MKRMGMAYSALAGLTLAMMAVAASAQTGGGTGAGAGVAAPVVPVYHPRTQPTEPATANPSETQKLEDQYAQQSATSQVAITAPTEFQQIVASTTGKPLPVFGANLFGAPPSTFSPVENIPVTPDYVIGPGDELRVQLWGQANQSNTYTVDRTGMIYPLAVGPIHVAGVQFAQLQDFLKAQFSRVYRNFDLNVNLGQMRSIQIFVVGQAQQPGRYTLSALSTLLNALFASGGPLPQGSLRDIQVKRGGKTVVHFDLYDLLLQGDKSHDVRLEPGDVIYIPAVGPQVAVLGSVNTPSIYELRGETSFEQLIALAGGRTSLAAGTSVRVERIADHKERSVVDVDLASGNVPPVENGDIVTVSPIMDRFRNAVTLRGNVANPGRYGWFKGMRVSDLIPDREALLTRNYYEKTNDLGQSNSDYRGAPQPGALSVAGETAAGAAPAASSAATAQGSANPAAQAAVAGTATAGGAGAAGEALTAHKGPFAPSTDVILQAPDIDWSYAVVERKSATDLSTSLITFNLGKAVLDKDASQNLELEAGDVVTVFSQADVHVPNAQQTRFVRLEGEFAGAGVYSVQPGETLRHLVERAGGFTPDAYLYASVFTRQSVQRLEKQRLDEFAGKMEAQVNTNASAAISGAVTDSDVTAVQNGTKNAQAVVEKLRRMEPSGRVVLELKPNSKGVASLPDIELEDGDRFIVPKVPSSVDVEGQVYNANAFVWEPGKRAKRYLEMAGGPDRSADRRRTYVLRADGSVESSQYRQLGRTVMYPGDTVVVPPVLSRGNPLRELGNIATILAGFGVAAAAIEVLR
jgi:protein involved in polysaccharide export with SLBB domain